MPSKYINVLWFLYKYTYFTNYCIFRGLGLETVLLNIIKVYCDPGNLVLVIGSSTSEENFWITQLKKDGIKPLPKVLTADISIAER